MTGTIIFYSTLRFLWQTLTSSTSKDTEFCSFSEIWDGFSVKQRAQYKMRKNVCPLLYICHSMYLCTFFPDKHKVLSVFAVTKPTDWLVSWQHGHKQLVKSKICLPSFWKNPVKVNCRCEDKLKREWKNTGETGLYQLQTLILIIECAIIEYLEPINRTTHTHLRDNQQWRGFSNISMSLKSQSIQQYKGIASTSYRAVLPWRILLSLHLLHCLQHIINFECFSGEEEWKTHMFRQNSLVLQSLIYIVDMNYVWNLSFCIFIFSNTRSHENITRFPTSWHLFDHFCETWRWASCAKIWAEKRKGNSLFSHALKPSIDKKKGSWSDE